MNKNINALINFKFRDILSTAEVYTLIILAIYSILAIIFYPWIEKAADLIWLNCSIGLAIISVAAIDSKFNGGQLFKIFRKLYLLPMVYLIYSQIQSYIKVINPYDYDYLLINLDKMIFGFNPTEALYNISNPILTEYLQFSYMTFFFMPLIQGIELHIKSKENEFNDFAAKMVLGFYISYLLYLILPAIGPRFTLHDFSNLSNELPGLWLSDIFREFVNTGGGIPLGAANPAAMVNRDCMPSGHTMMTVMNIYLAFRNKSSFKYLFFIIGISLIFATMYLRYHYVVDVIAGLFFAILTIKLEPYFRKLIPKKS